ncbi:hypothetical protein WMF01_30910 [Sorangium sp. So ce1667]
MPYEIFPDGRVRADTADEIISLWSKLREPAVETEAPRPSSAQDSWSILMRMLSADWYASQRHLLSILKKQDAPIDRDAFRQELGPAFRSNNVIGGTIAGLKKTAKKAGLDLETIIIRDGATYRPGPLLREQTLPWDDVT